MISDVKKQVIINEYLAGKTSFRKLSKIYNIDHRRIHSWVSKHKERIDTLEQNMHMLKPKKEPNKIPEDVQNLQRELKEARLLNAYYKEVINIAEERLGISIEKKSGTKRS